MFCARPCRGACRQERASDAQKCSSRRALGLPQVLCKSSQHSELLSRPSSSPQITDYRNSTNRPHTPTHLASTTLESLRILSLQILKIPLQIIICGCSRLQVIINLSYSLQKKKNRQAFPRFASTSTI